MTEVYDQPQMSAEEEALIFLGLQQVNFARGVVHEDRLHLSLDRKVSPDGWYQEKENRWVATIPNSFGLTAGESCPGKTAFCEDCYAVISEQSEHVGERVGHNLDLLQQAGDVETMAAYLTEAVGRFERYADKRGVSPRDKHFRIHWDGDFFSEDYAKAWALTMSRYPHIPFWAYTRSFVEPVDVVPILAEVDNLALYLSTDRYNADAAHQVAERHPSVRLALCDEDHRRAELLGRDRPTWVCPENIGKLALMQGSREDPSKGRGACVDCRWCIKASVDVVFSTTHLYDSEPQLSLFPDEAVPVALTKRPVAR